MAASDHAGALTLQAAAAELGVHYMTVYRYVRLGQIEAVKSGGAWKVSPAALTAFQHQQSEVPAGRGTVRWDARFAARLLAGDAIGAWQVVEAAQAGGCDLAYVYLRIITSALHMIGDRWARGEIDVADEHRASGIAMRIIGRLGPRCARRGRPRGTVVVGAPAGEQHAIASAILADLLRAERWNVSDLGGNTPCVSFAHTVDDDDVVAVGLSVTTDAGLAGCAAAFGAVRSLDRRILCVVGGQAITDDIQARALGADHYAPDPAAMLRMLDELSLRAVPH